MILTMGLVVAIYVASAGGARWAIELAARFGVHASDPEASRRSIALVGGATHFLVLAILAVVVSRLLLRGPGRTFERLGFGVRGLRFGACLTWAVGSLFPAYLGAVGVELLSSGPSTAVRALDDLLASDAGGPGLTLALVLLLTLGAASAEELLFRGFLLRSLLKALPAAWAVGIVTLGFAAAHRDPQWVLAVLPVSLWWTILAWRTGSTWPSWLGHALGNLIAASLTAWAGVPVGELPSWLHALAWTVAFPAFAIGVSMLLRANPRASEG